MSLSLEGGSLGQPSALPDVASFPDSLLDKAYVSLAAWSSGMILASGASSMPGAALFFSVLSRYAMGNSFF